MKIVFPVRFAAHHGAAVQTTSGEMTDSRMLLMCPQRRPPCAAPVALNLYLPDSFPPAAAMGRVGTAAGKPQSDGFWVDLVDAVRGVAERIEALMSLHAPRLNRSSPDGSATSPHRAAPRYPTSMPVTIGAGGALIAASIVYVGTENLWALRRGSAERALRHRWILTFAFGLVHGFGFAAVLRGLQLPRAALASGLVSFNIGVECGQVCIVLLALPVLRRLRRTPAFAPVASVCILVLGGVWLVSRLIV